MWGLERETLGLRLEFKYTLHNIWRDSFKGFQVFDKKFSLSRILKPAKTSK